MLQSRPRVAEVVPLGMSTSPYPNRIVARPGHEAELAKRTLTNLYNQRPAWLAQAHEALDAAVAAAYGWADYSSAMPDEEILRRLLALNRERAAAEAAASGGWKALAEASEMWRGAVATVTAALAEPMVRPVAFVFVDERGVTWVEPSYADPAGAPSPAMHRCEGTWLAWNKVRGPDWTVELSPHDPRASDESGVNHALECYSNWLAEHGKSWENERKAVCKLVKPSKG